MCANDSIEASKIYWFSAMKQKVSSDSKIVQAGYQECADLLFDFKKKDKNLETGLTANSSHIRYLKNVHNCILIVDEWWDVINKNKRVHPQ